MLSSRQWFNEVQHRGPSLGTCSQLPIELRIRSVLTDIDVSRFREVVDWGVAAFAEYLTSRAYR